MSRKSVSQELRNLPAWKWLARPAKQWDPAAKRDVWGLRGIFWGGMFVRAVGAAFLGGYLANVREGRPVEDILKIGLLFVVVAVGGLLVALPDEVLPKRGISRARKLLETSLDNGLVVLGGGFVGAMIDLLVEQKTSPWGAIVFIVYGVVICVVTGGFNSSLLAYRDWYKPEVERHNREKSSRKAKKRKPAS